MNNDAVRRQFTAALDSLVADLKRDRSILAAILCGSLSHDTVWSRSDIDLALVKEAREKLPLLKNRRADVYAKYATPQ